MTTELMKDVKESIEQSIKTSNLTRKIETFYQKNEDLENRLMGSTLIFRGVPESKKWLLGVGIS